ncbi:hypothetical protein GCM10027408_34970 [Microbacterium tumbae]
MLISADAGASGKTATIPARVPITAGEELGGLHRGDEDAFSVTELTGKSGVFIKIAAEDIRIEQDIEFDASDLAEGKYVYPSGEVSDDPCGMPGAFGE